MARKSAPAPKSARKVAATKSGAKAIDAAAREAIGPAAKGGAKKATIAKAPADKAAFKKADAKKAGAKRDKPRRLQDAPAAIAIRVYDFQNLPFLPADPVADPAGDPLHGGAYALMGEALAFWESEFGRRSYDGAGRRVVMFLRYPSGGGYYEPELEALRFSGPWPFEGVDGRRYYFGDFAQSPDYVAHEFAHAVTNYCGRLDYRDAEQAGLHESLSDCFAIAFRNQRARRLDPAAAVEWRFGAGTALPPLSCTRNIADPADPRAWSRGFSHLGDVRPDAQGGVDPYALAAIPSLAFRRVAEALGEDVMIAAHIWYGALSDPRMVGVASIAAFAELTVLAARHAGPQAEQATRMAWTSVGVGIAAPLAA